MEGRGYVLLVIWERRLVLPGAQGGGESHEELVFVFDQELGNAGM